MDAKYKREFGNEGRSDRFQMCAYAIGFDASHVSLVYPMSGPNAACQRTILNATFGGRELKVDSIALPMTEGPEACVKRLASLID